nr:MAG TPA: hypothetical protein [Caudoviricetes sp.]
MEQKKEIDLPGFFLRSISMTEKALDDAKVAIIDVEDPNTYDVAINKIAYATGLIDLNQELIGYMREEDFEKIMLGIVQNWDSRLAFLEELLEEQKPSGSKSAEPNGKTEHSDSYKFISDVRVFKKSDVDVKPDVIIVANPDFYAKEASADELARKIEEKLKKGIASKGE